MTNDDISSLGTRGGVMTGFILAEPALAFRLEIYLKAG
jgi:hypothetical protein